MERRFYNAKEIAYYLGVSEDAVRKWVARGYIPSHKLQKALRFDIIEIDAWLKRQKSAYVKQNFN